MKRRAGLAHFHASLHALGPPCAVSMGEVKQQSAETLQVGSKCNMRVDVHALETLRLGSHSITLFYVYIYIYLLQYYLYYNSRIMAI